MIRVFRFLEDGAWHSLKELAGKTGFPVRDLSGYCAVLSKHQVVEYDAESGRVRMGREFAKVIAALRVGDRAEKKWDRKGTGTVIVPPQKHLQIQGIHLQNMTEQDLRLEFTFKTKPIEIVISEV
jgi:hypothetical protein